MVNFHLLLCHPKETIIDMFYRPLYAYFSCVSANRNVITPHISA